MTKKHCDHCNKVIDGKIKQIEIRIGNYEDSAELCLSCMGELMHICGAFLIGERFKRGEDS